MNIDLDRSLPLTIWWRFTEPEYNENTRQKHSACMPTCMPNRY